MPARRVAGGIVVLTGRRWLGVAEWVQGTTDRRHKAGARLVRESPRRGGRFRRCPQPQTGRATGSCVEPPWRLLTAGALWPASG